MADVIHTEGEPSGSGAMGIIIGALIVVALLVGGWFLFFAPDRDADEPDTTIIEQEAPEGDTNIDEGDTNIVVPPADQESEPTTP